MLKLYFLEIRNRIGLIFFSWVLIFFICYCYKETLLFLVVKPLLKTSPEVCNYFIATNVTEIFSSYVLVSFFVGNQLTMFFLVSQVLSFFYPALYSYESKNLRNLILFSFLLWVLNIVVLNSFMFSYVFNFFLSFQNMAHKHKVT
jgi:sec-independent protein translocase protein TatC